MNTNIALPQGATLFLCSTVPASYAQSVAQQLVAMNRSDISFIDAPVSGGAGRAAAGTLTIMAGATAAALEKGRFLLQEMSDAKKLFIVEGGVGQGSNMKMVHQILAGCQILAASEAMGFASRLGLDAEEVLRAVVEDKQGSWSWMFENRVPRMLKEDYYPGVSALTIILKDVVCFLLWLTIPHLPLERQSDSVIQSIITSQARLHAFPIPLIAAAEQAFFTGLSNGWGGHDDASMVRLYTPTALSTPPPTPAADPEAAMTLVKSFLTSVHAAAAAEALAFAHKLEISLPQFYELANDAAGGSAQFRSCGSEIVAMLRGGSQTSAHTASLDKAIKNLTAVADEAQRLKMPMFLTAATLQVFLLARRSQSGKGRVSGVVGVYGV